MEYRLFITERADELLDHLAYYLVFQLKNEQAATHLFDEVEEIYSRLKENPYQFPVSRDAFLARKGYYDAILSSMHYVIVFQISQNTVYVMGIFHQLEDYRAKLY